MYYITFMCASIGTYEERVEETKKFEAFFQVHERSFFETHLYSFNTRVVVNLYHHIISLHKSFKVMVMN